MREARSRSFVLDDTMPALYQELLMSQEGKWRGPRLRARPRLRAVAWLDGDLDPTSRRRLPASASIISVNCPGRARAHVLARRQSFTIVGHDFRSSERANFLNCARSS